MFMEKIPFLAAIWLLFCNFGFGESREASGTVMPSPVACMNCEFCQDPCHSHPLPPSPPPPPLCGVPVPPSPPGPLYGIPPPPPFGPSYGVPPPPSGPIYISPPPPQLDQGNCPPTPVVTCCNYPPTPYDYPLYGDSATSALPFPFISDKISLLSFALLI